MVRDTNELKVSPLALLRHGATAVAAARVALGVAALARPSVPARPWVGEPADELTLQVLGRAPPALRRSSPPPPPPATWPSASARSPRPASSRPAPGRLPRGTRPERCLTPWT
jgi:hypothetical protein